MHVCPYACCLVLIVPSLSPSPSGSDLSKWAIKRWWFNGQFFNTIQDMISSWNADNKGLRSSFKLLKPGGWWGSSSLTVLTTPHKHIRQQTAPWAVQG